MTALAAPAATKKIGNDTGNATTTVADAAGNTAFLPSFVAKTRRAANATITYKGIHYVIGADALEVPGHDSLMAESLTEDKAYLRYLEDRSFAAFLAGVSALYPDEPSLDVDLGTGLPISLYEPHGDMVARRFNGTHEYAHFGRPRAITIRARVFGEGLEVLRLLPPEQRMGRIAVHDIGGRTYGIALFNDRALKSRRSYDAGIDRLLGDIAIISNDPGARWHIQCEMRRNPKAHPELRAELAQSIADHLAVAEGKQRLPDADRHIVIGGGATIGAGVIKARYGKPVIVLDKDEPQSVNARAFAAAISEVR